MRTSLHPLVSSLQRGAFWPWRAMSYYRLHLFNDAFYSPYIDKAPWLRIRPDFTRYELHQITSVPRHHITAICRVNRQDSTLVPRPPKAMPTYYIKGKMYRLRPRPIDSCSKSDPHASRKSDWCMISKNWEFQNKNWNQSAPQPATNDRAARASLIPSAKALQIASQEIHYTRKFHLMSR
jgi:hypothetical protein